MTPSLRAARSVRPRVCNVPKWSGTAGTEAVEFAAGAGLILDPWQEFVLENALGEQADGRWAAFEVALIVSRQNGKGSVLEARELAGLFLFGENLILHSAHEFKTASEAFRRVLALVENTDDLRKKVKRIHRSHGDEGIELLSGARLRFVARSTGSGRGFSGDCVILDEAYNLSGAAMAALLPTLSARPNPQLWYASSAGMSTSEQLHAVRKRGLADNPGDLAYMDYGCPDDADFDDVENWRMANPAYGIRISEEFIRRERAALGDAEFGRERLGIWDGGGTSAVIDFARWSSLKVAPQTASHVAFAVEVTQDRSMSVVVAATRLDDGRDQLEVVERARGTDWVVPAVARLRESFGNRPVAVDPGGPAGALIPPLRAAGVNVVEIGSREYGQACGSLFDAVVDGTVAHLGDPDLDSAVAGAGQRAMGPDGAWKWAGRTGVDVRPLVAATLARWALGQGGDRDPVNNVW